MTDYEQAIQLMGKLSVVDKARLLEFLSAALKRDLESEAYKQIPWEQFLELTYGSLADDPLEREQPPFPDERDAVG